MTQFHAAFFDESLEALDAMESGLLQMDAGNAKSDRINTLFRLAHSIKGNAGMLGFTPVASFTHTMESLLAQVRANQRPFSQPVADALLLAVDALRNMVVELRHGRGPTTLSSDAMREELKTLINELPAQAAVIQAAVALKACSTANTTNQWSIRFSARESLLDAGIDPVQLFADLSALGPLQVTSDTSRLPTLAELNPSVCHIGWELHLQTDAPQDSIELLFDWAERHCDLIITQLPAPEAQNTEQDAASVRMPLAKIDAVQLALNRVTSSEAQLQTQFSRLAAGAGEGMRFGLTQLQLQLRQLQEEVRRLRMLPVDTLFGRFPRLVRDAGASMGKQIRLTTGGNDTELDRSILERLGDPLLHLVRNCIDHGIELPQVRVAAGKPAEGHVHIEVAASAGLVVIEVSDDGKGLDSHRILDKARARGVLQTQTELTEQQVHELIFLPGLSTVDVATDLSGRGVGMDVVRCNVETLGGSIELQSTPGKGTRFTLCLPIAVDGQIMGESVADGLLLLRHSA
jgi:two-component system chemotaxis sensor kinase CheA